MQTVIEGLPAIYSEREAAAYLRVSNVTIRRMRKAGRIAFVTIGKHALLHRAAAAAVPGASDMPRVRITDEYSLTKRKGSDRWYLEWREDGQKKRRATGTASVEEAKAGPGDVVQCSDS